MSSRGLVPEKATAHDCDDCILLTCTHPAHFLEDAVVDLSDYLGDAGFSSPELVPIFM